MELKMEFDLVVIGGGSGGVRAARLAKQTGANVALVEDGMMGGTCVNVGCVPKKLYVNASLFQHYFDLSSDYGWSRPESSFSLKKLLLAKNKEIARLKGVYGNTLKNNGVSVLEGRAKIVSPTTVRVGNKLLQTKKILIATGSSSYMPKEFPGIDHAVTSDGIFSLQEVPEKALVYGGSYIAIEMAGILARMGAEVHLVYRGDRLLKNFDSDIVSTMQSLLVDSGVRLHLQTSLSRLERVDNRIIAHSHNKKLSVDFVLFALGREANVFDLGVRLDDCDDNSLKLEATNMGFIRVDDNYQTSVQGIYALGDVIGTAQLTPLAIAQAMDFVGKHFDYESAPRMPKYIPTCVFCHPPLATVGSQEHDLQRHNIHYACYSGVFKPMHLSLGNHNERVHYKILVEQHSNLVVGVHMLGEYAGEIVQSIAAAMEAGVTKNDLDATLAIHPTIAEELVTNYTPGYVWPPEGDKIA